MALALAVRLILVATSFISSASLSLSMADRRATWLRSDYRAGAERFRGGRGALRPRVQQLALELSVRVGWARITSMATVALEFWSSRKGDWCSRTTYQMRIETSYCIIYQASDALATCFPDIRPLSCLHVFLLSEVLFVC